jgi:MOSC domain-containing protein YiiM
VTGRIIQVSVSNGGVPKRAVLHAHVGRLGLEGDRQAHPQFHGGPRQAVLLICAEAMDALKAEGFPVFYGALGENLTTQGLDHRQMRVGQRFRAGEAILELTKLRVPCKQLNPYGPGIQKAVYDERVKAGDPTSPVWGIAGFYASVLEPGLVRPGDGITLLEQVV